MRTKQIRLKLRSHFWQAGLAIAALLLAGIPLQQVSAAGGTAGFAFADNNSTFNVGGTVNVELLESGTNVQTVWANLTYPTGLLQFQQANFDNSLNTVASGGVNCSVDPASGNGQISLRCTALTPPNGTEVVTDLQFTVLAPGTATLSMVAGGASATDITDSTGTSIWDGALPHVTYTLKGKSTSSGSTGATPAGGSSGSSGPSSGASGDTSNNGSTSSNSSTATSQGQAGSLDLSVSDALGRSLGGARVAINDGTEHYTDTNGKTSFSLPAGTYSVGITAPGMVTQTLRATVAAGKDKRLSLQLSPAAPGSALGLLAVIIVAAYFGRSRLRSLRLMLPVRRLQPASGQPLAGIVVGDGGLITPNGTPVGSSPSQPARPNTASSTQPQQYQYPTRPPSAPRPPY